MMNTQSLYLQNKIAVIWDFDKTLIRGHMQAPLFAHFGVDEKTFWRETNSYKTFLGERGLELFSADSYYLLHILAYVRAGRFKGLNNALLHDLGQKLTFLPGLPTFFRTLRDQATLNPSFRPHDIEVEHYIVSNGLRQMILGSSIGPLAREVWGCEFVEELPEPGYLSKPKQMHMDSTTVREIKAVGYQVDNTSKTRAIFEINKGSRVRNIDVNDSIPYELRRIPFQNMVYVADGKSDVPVFSILNQYGGHTFAVYDPAEPSSFAEVNDLLKQGRVDCIGPADYSKGTMAWYWISDAVRDIAEQIVRNRQSILDERVGRAHGYSAEPETQRVDVLTQESLLDDLRPRVESPPNPRPEAPVVIAGQGPLIVLQAPDHSAGEDADLPKGFLETLDQISDRYKPVTDDEMRQLVTLVRSRAGARSDGGRRRRSPNDRLSSTPSELEAYLDGIREGAAQADSRAEF